MATVPLSGTNIRLLSGVPFSNDYKHTRWFDTIAQQTSYFTSKPIVHSITTANFQRIEGKHFIASEKSIDELWGTNYLMFQNAQYNSQWFYAFVTKLEYVQKNTTYVHFEIDVFQTWKFVMDFKPSYVVREHCPLWNADGSPVINTVDEGLDYGKDYEFVDGQNYMPFTGLMFLVVVAKSTLHTADGYPGPNYIKASLNGSAQPLSFYVHPFDLLGNSPDIFLDGSAKTLSPIMDVLNTIYSVESAVNNIVSMYITDHIGVDFQYTGSLLIPDEFSLFQQLKVVNVGSVGPEIPVFNTIYIENMFTYATTTITGKLKYLDFGGIYNAGTWTFPNLEESKLLMYPYSFAILDDFKGNRIELKNEYISGNQLDVEVMGSLGASNKVAYIPKNYLTENLAVADRDLVGIETAIVDKSPHDVAIITDMLAAFLQGNRNSLQNQANTIAFNGMMDIVGGGIGGAASAVGRNPLGVASGVTGIVKGGGNAVLQLQGLQAKLKDINNVPPSLVKMGGNTAFEYGNGYYGFWLITKQIKPEYRKKLADFFKLYGYKVNEVKTPNFHTRQNWNYVQTVSCNIIANLNNEDLQELKNVFDAGITLWHTDDVGNYSLTNEVI